MDSHWGGLHIIGNGPTNCVADPVQKCVYQPFGAIYEPDYFFGGTNDPDDSSGILRYVRIEGGGRDYVPVETSNNGLGLICVGKGTILDFVEVSHSVGDGTEIMGGNVNIRHFYSKSNYDEDFDISLGYTGKMQFLYVLRDPTLIYVNAFPVSSQNDPNASLNLPITQAVISNMTILLPGQPSTTDIKYSFLLQRNSQTSIFNSAVIGPFQSGIMLTSPGPETELKRTFLGGTLKAGAIQSITDWFNTSGWGNQWFQNANDVQLENWQLKRPLPLSGSPLLEAASFSISPQLQDTFFEEVSYTGAFSTVNWTKGWAEGNGNDCQVLSTEIIEKHKNLHINPNPSRSGFWLTIDQPNQQKTWFHMIDISGKTVREGEFSGTEFYIERGKLPAGFYFLKLNQALQPVKVMKLIFE